LEKLHFKQNYRRLILLWAKSFLLFAVLSVHLSHAGNQSPSTQTQNDEKETKIHITSDKMISESGADYIEFIGNVRATQEANIVTGDRLKFFFKEGLDDNTNLLAGEESIDKIVVNGNVKIILDDKTAISQKAVYTTASRILVLTGPDSKIISGKDSVSGEKITLYRADERIIVESGKEKQVEAVFFSKQGGLD